MASTVGCAAAFGAGSIAGGGAANAARVLTELHTAQSVR